MVDALRKLLAFSGKHKPELVRAFLFGVLYSFFEVIPFAGIVLALQGLLLPAGKAEAIHVWGPFCIMASSVAGKIFWGKRALDLRMLAGYRICADKRIQAGETLKRAPMGYFDENRLGEIAAALTTSIGEIETLAVSILDKLANGFVHAMVISLVIFLYDWQVGVITLGGLTLSLTVYYAMQKKSEELSPLRQSAQSALVAAVLEYIQGMAVVKAFGLGERSQRAIDSAIEASRASNIALERAFSLLIGLYQLLFKAASVLVLITACLQYFDGSIALTKCLALLTASFMLYAHIEVMGSVYAVSRAIGHSLNRLEALNAVPLMDEGGKDITPEHFNIRLENVSFSYGEHNALENIDITLDQGTVTAVVGPSGSGKTTLCNLITRFWDAQKGSVLFGGINVREYRCDSLLSYFSMVFQNVYLFEDSIRNNIRFGRPDASQEEIEKSARRACCHDFIAALPEGYDTLVGEGGCSLSGGERQRIALARAILKDAPIIILDEATASLDPENERKIQEAFAELTRNKTVIMIAHRLSTVRHADQILVLEKGKIVQRGKHEDLMRQGGLYKNFIQLREKAAGWSLGATRLER
jgi:ATP-binding cassette subfamily B protein